MRFLKIALGSLRELDTQLIIAQKVGLAKSNLFEAVMAQTDELQRIMVSTLQKLED